MTKISKLCFLLNFVSLVVLFSCETDGPDNYKKHFIKYYGGDGSQEGKDFVINADGSVVMLGTWYETDGRRRIFVVKVDEEGREVWSRKLGSSAESGQDIEFITNGADAGNLVILSNVTKNVADSTAIRLTVINQEGDSLKSVLFDRLESQRAVSVTPLLDGGYYVVGNTTDTDTNPQNTGLPNGVIDFEDELVIKFEANWNVATPFRLGGSTIASGIKVFQIALDEFYYAGYWDAIEGTEGVPYEPDFVFRTFQSSPNSIDSKFVGQKAEDEYLSAISKGFVGGYLAVGTRVTASKSIVAVRVGTSFTTVGSMQLVEADAEATAVTSSQYGGFFIVGNKIGVGGVRNICLIKTDGDGTKVNKVEFGARNNDDTGSAVYELPSGDVLILGTVELVNQRKMTLIKTRPNGSF